MSSCRTFDRFQPFYVSSWKPKADKAVRYGHSELGYFSIDEERHFLTNKSKLGTLQLPQDCSSLDIDLNVGFEQWKELPNVQQHLDSMLQWILLNKGLLTTTGDFRASNDGGRLDVDFVTSRGNLARILNILSGKGGKGHKWTLLATRYRGTIYLSHIEENPDEELSAFARRICYWGKRFEVEVTSPTREASLQDYSSAPPPGNEVYGPLKAYPGFFSVVRFQLEDHRIALRAEIDAQTQVLDEQQIPDYVELKVTTETIVRAPWAFKRKRLVPWWCQSIVSGTPLVVYGIRDYDGHVRNIEHVRTNEIPDRVGRENLDKEEYLLFLSDMLSWIKDIVSAEDVTAVYAFQWDPNAPANGVTANALRDVENSFLPEWYLNEMEDYFACLCDQRQSKGKKRKMENETEKRDQKMEMKDVRKRFEESWPRSGQSGKSNTYEKPHRGDQSHPRSSRSYDARDRGRATLEKHGAADEERCSKRGPFHGRDYKRDHPTTSGARRKDIRRPMGVETRIDRDHKTSTRDYRQKSPPHVHRSSREEIDNARRYERRHHEEEDKIQSRAWLVNSPLTTSRAQRSSYRDDYLSDVDRMSEELRIKRTRRDAEYDLQGSHRQDFRRYEHSHWN